MNELVGALVGALCGMLVNMDMDENFGRDVAIGAVGGAVLVHLVNNRELL